MPSIWDLEADLVIAGSGGGGLVAAIVAHDLGLKPVVLESAPKLGGGTALATGGIWIPMNHRMLEAGLQDDREAALSYVLAVCQGHELAEAREIAEAYVDHAATAIQYLEQHTPLRMEGVVRFPDYRMDLPGGRYGRTMTPAIYDAKQLGAWADRVRKGVQAAPVGLHEIDKLGGTARIAELDPDLVPQRLRDDIRAGGAAGIAALVRACLDREVPLLTEHRVVRLVSDGARVQGAIVQHGQAELAVRARQAVMLATGGADWDERNNRRNLRKPFDGAFTPPSNQGDGQRLGSALGLPLALMDESAWCPAYQIPGEQHDGKPLYRQCVADRCLPHSIVVNRYGRRFVNESLPYNDFVRSGAQAWDGQRYEFPNRPMFIIVDQQYREQYNLCGVRPTMPTPDWMATGSTLRDLAGRLGIDPDGLEATVERFNAAAREGVDADFHRGEAAYDRYQGDSRRQPNPALGTLERGPFYGLPLYVSTFGHKGGLITNRYAQVLDMDDKPVPGLYALGNTAASFHMNIGYVNGGVIGRSMTFGYIAARHSAGQS